MSGQEVRRKIEASGVTFAEVARRIGISAQALNSRLNAENIKSSHLEEMAVALNTTVYFFLDSEEKPLQAIANEEDPPYYSSGSEIKKKLRDCEDKLKDRDELIRALRQTISVYERLFYQQNNAVVQHQ